MIPIRLTILLLGVIVIMLIIFNNPINVEFKFLFWNYSLKLYEVILLSILFGIFLAVIYLGQVKQLKRARENQNKPTKK